MRNLYKLQTKILHFLLVLSLYVLTPVFIIYYKVISMLLDLFELKNSDSGLT
jgi:hypothetical protein